MNKQQYEVRHGLDTLDTAKGFHIYRNLNKDVFSIQGKFPRRNWVVHAYGTHLLGHGAFFRVGETGRQKVIEEKKKNVHAWVHVDRYEVNPDLKKWKIIGEVYYDPYRVNSFINKETQKPLDRVDTVLFVYPKVFLVEPATF